MRRVRTILVPIDFSPHSGRALDLAIDLAEALRASLHLVHSCAFPRRLVTVYDVVFPEKLHHEIYDAAQAKLDTWLARAAGRDVEAGGELTLEEASEMILRLARERSVDLIVMGTRGLGEVTGTLLGSVAARIVRHAPCPVVTVRADVG